MNRSWLYVEFFKVFWEVAQEKHRQYVGTDKPHGQAASFESLLIFKNKVYDYAWRHSYSTKTPPILDAGAGASSLLLRSYFDNVISCDPDVEYLADVQLTCRTIAERLEAPELVRGWWEAGFPTGNSFQYCYYDFGTHQRRETLLKALEQVQYGIYVDDADERVDCKEMRDFVHNAIEGSRWDAEDCHDARDEHGRWGIYLSSRG